ncbi:MAG TPA: hypothetical protein VHM92_13205 [Allosphingosinicella sp.]|nr:hypothetical protein [Allosphingosinicella sp.]
MSRQPSYPKDAAIGAAGAPGGDTEGGPPVGAMDAPAPASRRTKHMVAGAAIGIGSAAIVAALLYANRRRNDR